MTQSNDLIAGTSLGSIAVSPDAVPITGVDAPSDTVDQPSGPFRALRSMTAGKIAVYTPKSPTVARVMDFLAGETRYVAVTRILLTGTTATGIEGLP
jgi:hypothetical protein